MRSVYQFALAMSLLLSAAMASLAEEPMLRRVLLSTGGVAYFGYDVAADADGRVRLTVPLAQVDDILKSLTVLGADGRVRSVSLLGPTPLADLFRDLPFGADDLVDLPSLLLRLRGTEVEIKGPAAMRGRIVTVAREEVTEAERTTARHRLSLAGPDGISSVILETIDGIAFADPELQRRLNLVLARLVEGATEQEREIEIALGGSAGDRVGLGYLAEMPMWKASWRLVVGGKDGLLQGWAILENASGRDWRDVAVTLIGGSPHALRQALYASHYVARAEVPVEGEIRKERRTGDGAAAVPPALAAESMDMLARSSPAALETRAAQELTAQTLFPLPQPVTLAVGHTAMAPIVDRQVQIERVALYRAAEGGPHPNAALRLRNSTGASLPAGLATLYEMLPEGGLTFLGDALLPQLAPNSEELLVYGLDGNIDVAVQEEAKGRADRARIEGGVLEVTRLEQERFAYAVTARFSGASRDFVVEQERPAGWRVAEPADAVVEGNRVRVRRNLDPASRFELAIVLERPVVQRFGLLDHDPEELLLQFEGVEAPPELRHALGRLQELSRRVAELERQIAEAETKRGELAQDQSRLRENLAAVPRDSDLARRYLDGLAASEDGLTALASRFAATRTELESARAARAEFVRSLKV
jgi:hypothetical protein